MESKYKIVKSKTINIHSLSLHNSMDDSTRSHNMKSFINFEKEVEEYLNKGYELVNEAKFIAYNDKTAEGCFIQTVIKK